MHPSTPVENAPPLLVVAVCVAEAKPVGRAGAALTARDTPAGVLNRGLALRRRA